MDLLIYIKNGCEQLTATASPSVDAIGLHMVLALATIMLVWFGVQEALASAHGGAGFNIARFLSFFLLITFAYCSVGDDDTDEGGKNRQDDLDCIGAEKRVGFRERRRHRAHFAQCCTDGGLDCLY